MRIDIVGSVASGKTTLARRLSEKYQVPFYEKDNIVYARTSQEDIRRTKAERDVLFQEIIGQKDWIVEGSPREILRESFITCDYIIVLDVPLHTRLYRTLRRWIRQRIGTEKYNSKPTLEFLYCNFKWVIGYHQERATLIKDLAMQSDKIYFFKNGIEVERFLEEYF
ncbi:AAA family ATPase [Amphibacillus sp. Q70]|uniref:AAA family ATPase n=1 Tax=Amphibacillus sp. Q70 TaxID=3453416 RepID=UPI003F84C575